MTEKLLTAEDVADILRKQPQTVLKMARRGELPKVMVGRSVRFEAKAIDRCIRGWAS